MKWKNRTHDAEDNLLELSQLESSKVVLKKDPKIHINKMYPIDYREDSN